jgi:hypothetical protein
MHASIRHWSSRALNYRQHQQLEYAARTLINARPNYVRVGHRLYALGDSSAREERICSKRRIWCSGERVERDLDVKLDILDQSLCVMSARDFCDFRTWS